MGHACGVGGNIPWGAGSCGEGQGEVTWWSERPYWRKAGAMKCPNDEDSVAAICNWIGISLQVCSGEFL